MAYFSKLKVLFIRALWITLVCINLHICLIPVFIRAQIIPIIGHEPIILLQEVLVRYQPQISYNDVLTNYTNTIFLDVAQEYRLRFLSASGFEAWGDFYYQDWINP